MNGAGHVPLHRSRLPEASAPKCLVHNVHMVFSLGMALSFVFVGAHPVGDGRGTRPQFRSANHRTQGWAPTKKPPLNVVQDLKGPDQEGVNVQKNQTSSGLAPKPHRPGAQSIERAMGLVNLVARHHDQGISLQAMVQLSGLDRTTAWRMLGSLQSANLVARDDHTGLYTLGVQATSWGAASLGQSALIRQCQPAMKTLARLSGDNVFLVLRLGDYSHCLHLEQGAHAVPSFRQTVGETRLLGLGVASLAMLAVLDDTAIQAHHARHSAQYELEGVAHAQLQRWVQATRQRGHAYRSTAGIAAVGLHWHLGHAANAALSIGAARTRLPLARAAELATLMRNHCPQLVAPVSRIFPSL